ncbi:hypothetical protein ABIB83_005392 [Bradyrhizobium sp. I1.8.5]
MPRYFFHVTHKRRELDREGYELTSTPLGR